MKETLTWVYNNVDPDLITAILLALGVVTLLFAIVPPHSKTNDKRLDMVVAFAIVVLAVYNTTNLKWYNSFATHERRAGMNKVVYIGSELYMVSETPSDVITLTRIDVYSEEFAKRYEETYGCVGNADVLLIDVKPKERSLDCSTPK